MLLQRIPGLLRDPPADDYPNHLARPEPERVPLPRRTWLLAALVLLCLLPRFAMAWRITAIAPDGVLYVRLAQALEDGSGMSGEFRWNIYPAILAGLHRLGLDWETAGTSWGVVLSSLVVLPLYGWVRRQFDDRVALIAWLLYAVHPRFIMWSPEIMRDSTFWFLLMLSLYLLWRAAVEVRAWLFVAAGAAVTLAVSARFEGFFLLVPLTAWTFWRFLALKRARGRLALGAVLCVFTFPLLTAAATGVRHLEREGWAMPRWEPLKRAEAYFFAVAGQERADRIGGTIPPDARLSAGRMLFVFFPTMTRGLAPEFALLMFAGIWRWRHLWARRDHQALFLTALVFMAAIWIHLWCDSMICPRYALPIVLMGSGFAALGLLGLTAWMHRRIAGRVGERGSAAAAFAPLAFVALLGVLNALTSQRSYLASREAARDLGRWVQREMGSSAAILGPADLAPIAGYYAGGRAGTYRIDVGDERTILPLVQQRRPDLVMLRPTKRMDAGRTEALSQRLRGEGFVPAEFAMAQPPRCPKFFVLRRDETCRLALDPPSQASN